VLLLTPDVLIPATLTKPGVILDAQKESTTCGSALLPIASAETIAPTPMHRRNGLFFRRAVITCAMAQKGWGIGTILDSKIQLNHVQDLALIGRIANLPHSVTTQGWGIALVLQAARFKKTLTNSRL
jgi:hypothetical protein